MTDQRPPADGYRAISWPSEVREDAGRPPRLVGHFARFDTFNEIDSVREGKFMERIAPGAFKKTFAENKAIKVLFQHGRDPSVGEQPIAKVVELREDKHGPYYEAELLEGVPPLVMAGLREGVYGVSYRFSVDPARDEYNPSPGKSPANPKGLPERTIRQAWVYEFGPVTFPADAGATVAVRSLSDEMSDPIPNDPVAPSLDAAAETPHLELERSDEPVTVVAIQEKESPKLDTKYHTLDEMGARVRELDAEIKRAAELPGVLPDAEQVAFDEKVAERAALDHAMTSWRNRLAQVREAKAVDEPPTGYEPVASFVRKTESDIYDIDAVYTRSRNPEQRNQMLRDNAMRSIEITTSLTGDNRDHAAKLVDYKDSRNKELATRIITTGSPQYRRAWNAYVSDGERGTALAVGADGTGGFAVPYAYDLSVIGTGAHTFINPFRAACRVEQIVGTDTWRGLTANAVVAAFDDEAAAATEQGPTFTQPEIIVKKAHAFVTYSISMGQDRPDLGQELAVLINEAKDNIEEAEFAVGTGATHHPHGMLSPLATLLYTHIELSTAHAIVIADIDATEAALPLRHRQRAAWFMNKAIFRVIQGLETSGGRLFGGDYYAAVAANGNNANGSLRPLLGYPVYEVPSAVDTLLTDDLFVMWFGDPKSFVIVDRVGMSVEYIPTIFGAAQGNLPTGQRGLYAYWRTNSDTVNADAGRLVQVKNA